jgi:fatty acid desaturase
MGAVGKSRKDIMLITIVIIVLLVLALGGGGYGYSHYGGWSWSPAAVILLIGAIMLFTGHLHFG